MKKYYISLIIKVAIIAILIGLDILTKLYFQNYFLEGGKEYDLIKGVLGVTYVQNSGAAFGLLGGGRVFLIISTIVFLLVFFCIEFYYKNTNGWYVAGFCLIIGGAIGNFIDRVSIGEVRDFLQFKFIDFPIFNFADVCLTMGVICYFIYLFFYEGKKSKKVSGK